MSWLARTLAQGFVVPEYQLRNGVSQKDAIQDRTELTFTRYRHSSSEPRWSERNLLRNGYGQAALVFLRQSSVYLAFQFEMAVRVVHFRKVKIGEGIVLSKFSWMSGDGHRVNGWTWRVDERT